MYNPPSITKNPQMPVVLIAGGAGFIGSHLTEYLLSQSFRVVVIDNLKTGTKELIELYTGHPRFAFFQHDLNLGIPQKIESADYIIHLAGEELHLSEKDDPNMDSLLTNALATHNLLDFAKTSGSTTLLASSINVYQGALSSSNLEDYFGTAPEEEKGFSFFESKRFAESLAFEYHKKYKLDIRVARLSEVYGPKMDLKSTSNLGRFIESVINGNSLVVFGDGLEKEHYCYISDAIDGLIKCLLKTAVPGGIYPITELKPITVLELAYLVKSFALPGTQIIFKPKADYLDMPEVRITNGRMQKELKWKPRIALRDGIKLTLDYFGLKKDIFPPTKTGGEKNNLPENFIPAGRIRREERRLPEIKLPRLNFGLIRNLYRTPRQGKLPLRLIIFLTSLIIFIFSLPFLQASFSLGSAYLEFRHLKSDLKDFKIADSINRLEKIDRDIAEAGRFLESAPIYKNGATANLLNSASLLTKSITFSLRGASPLVENLLRVTSGQSVEAGAVPGTTKSGSRIEDMDSAVEDFSSALDYLNLAKADFKEIDKSRLPFFIRGRVEPYGALMANLGETFVKLRLLSSIASNILGIDEEKTYLLVFQNSNELRPTGGFIGSLAKIDIKNGVFRNIKIIDVYDIDGKIDERQIKLKQPQYLSENLKTEYLHLRDANFSPSFPESARRIQDLYSRVTEERVDGVIAVDLATVEGLLKITGPIFLPTYNETVGGENLFERTQFHSEAAYFPGSSQKKTFLAILSQQLIEGLLSLERKKYFRLISDLDRLSNEKHLLVYIPDVQSVISQLNLDGRILNTGNDYLMVVDTNVGSTKSNYFVERSIEYQLEKNNREGEYLGNLRISYQHNGTANTWPGGPYKNYLRVYVPKKSSLLKATISHGNDEEKADDITGKTEVGEDGGKTFFAATITVETGRHLNFNVSYILPAGTVPVNEDKYQLLVQKQPGTRADRFTLKLTVPFGAALPELPKDLKLIGDSVEWQGNLNTDRLIEIPLKP